MDKRQQELIEIKNFTKSVDSEITMILQNLQWDKKTLMQKPNLVVCKYDKHHTIPAEAAEAHEKQCFYKYNGYSINDEFLPDFDENACNAVKLSQENINKILHEASTKDPSLKKVLSYLYPEFEQCLGTPCKGPQPMTLAQLQCTYTADERRAIYDAVVKTCPTTLDPFNLKMLNADGSQSTNNERGKSRLELEAELRDMKRRRVRYRGACPDKNYSHVLRGLIETQMETFSSLIKIDQNKERKSKEKPQKEHYDLAYKSNRSSDHKFRDYSANKSKHSSSYDNLNISYDKERKRKYESGHHHKEEKYKRHDYFNDNSYRHRHTSNAEKYEETSRTSRSLQSSHSRYDEDESKYSSTHRNTKSIDDKKRYKERDKCYNEKKGHYYSETHRNRRSEHK